MSKSLGETIASLRKSAGISSQHELARLLDVDPSYITRLENGEREPSLSFLRKFGRKTSIPFPVLLAKALTDGLEKSERKMYGDIVDQLIEVAELTPPNDSAYEQKQS